MFDEMAVEGLPISCHYGCFAEARASDMDLAAQFSGIYRNSTLSPTDNDLSNIFYEIIDPRAKSSGELRNARLIASHP